MQQLHRDDVHLTADSGSWWDVRIITTGALIGAVYHPARTRVYWSHPMTTVAGFPQDTAVKARHASRHAAIDACIEAHNEFTAELCQHGTSTREAN